MLNPKKNLFTIAKEQLHLLLKTLRVTDQIPQITFDDFYNRLKIMEINYPTTTDFIEDIKRFSASSAKNITIGTPTTVETFIEYSILHGPYTIIIKEKV